MSESYDDQDTHTEVSVESWGSRIAGSLVGILVGVVLVLVSLVLLWWNEGRAVQTAKSLEEGGGVVLPISADKIDPGNEGKLVYLSGLATTDETLKDPVFNVSGQALRLSRDVEMYQWDESKEQQQEKKLGGKEVTTTTYSYNKGWHSSLINSANFEKQREHENPAAMPYKNETYKARKVTLGAFILPAGLAGRISGDQQLSAAESQIPAKLRGKAQINGGKIYVGSNPSAPTVGDLMVSHKIVNPATVSIIAKQSGSSLAPYKTSAGNEIYMLEKGAQSAATMFQAAESGNTTMTWILRVVGFVLMFAGFKLVFNPLVVLADVLPFLGSLVSVGTGLVSFLLAGPLTLITIAISWIFYRPLLGGILLVVAIGGIVAIKFMPKKS